jgi:hypothetical protein
MSEQRPDFLHPPSRIADIRHQTNRQRVLNTQPQRRAAEFDFFQREML